MAAPSAQIATVRQIALCKQYLDARGFLVMESQPYTTVHRVHEDNSFHYLSSKYLGKAQSLAADINVKGGGATERKSLIAAIPVIQAFGISIIYARDGVFDAAKFHQDHLHMDVGSFTNLGRAWTKTVKKDLCVYDTQLIVHLSTRDRNNIDNAETTKRLRAVQMASRLHGGQHPYGIRYTQAVIGAPLTNKWDIHSVQAHDRTVQAIEKLWKPAGLFKGTPNTTWSKDTDTALTAFHKRY